MENEGRKLRFLYVLVVVQFIIIIGIVIYLLRQNNLLLNQSDSFAPTQNSTNVVYTSPTPAVYIYTPQNTISPYIENKMQKSGWTSYENNQEGFRISYPLRFKMTEIIQNKLLEFVEKNTLKGPDGYLYFNLSIEKNPQNLSVEDFAKSKDELFYLDQIKLVKPYDRFNNVGVKGLQFAGYGHPAYDGSLYLKRNSNVLIIKGLMADENLFNEILATIEFLQ